MTAEIVTIVPKDLVQGSPEWHAFRCGKVTASRVADIVGKTKTGWGASRAGYMAELINEILEGKPAETYTNADMQWGILKEPEARFAYAFDKDLDVELVGFVPHPRIAMAGCSPDGLVGDDGLVEIKVPRTSTHCETVRGKKIPEKYITQIQFQLACTGRQWCDFISYAPRLLPKYHDKRLFVHRLERDDKMIAFLEKAVEEFIAELIGKVVDFETYNGSGPSRLLTELRAACGLEEQ